MLVHCRAGLDRTGFVTALYRHIIKQEPIDSLYSELSKYSRTSAEFEKFLYDYERDSDYSDNYQFEIWIEKEKEKLGKKQ